MSIRTLSSRIVYENPWMTLREDEIEHGDGSRGIYAVVDKPDFALVIPAENDGFHLVEEYRYPLGGRYWQFPQGTFPRGGPGRRRSWPRRSSPRRPGSPLESWRAWAISTARTA